jgi:hypothetical protein
MSAITEYLPILKDITFFSTNGFVLPFRDQLTTDSWYVKFRISKKMHTGIVFSLLSTENNLYNKHLLVRYDASNHSIKLTLHAANETLLASTGPITNVEDDMYLYYLERKIVVFDPENNTSVEFPDKIDYTSFAPDHLFLPRNVSTDYSKLEHLGIYPGFNKFELTNLIGLILSIEYADEYVPPVEHQVPIIVTSQIPDGIQNQLYNASLLALASAYPLTWSAEGLPPGLTIIPSSGIITGVPTTVGSSYAIVTVTDNYGLFAQKQYFINIRSLPYIVDTELPIALQNEEYNHILTGAGGEPPYIWGTNTLPEGMYIDLHTGKLYGKSTTVGEYTVKLHIQDQNTLISAKDFNLIIAVRPLIADIILDPVIYSYPHSLTLSVKPGTGTAPFTWNVTGLVPGLTFNASTATISGTIRGLGSYYTDVQVIDAYRFTDSVRLLYNVGWPEIEPLLLEDIGDMQITTEVSTIITPVASGGMTPYKWSAEGLPPGMTINTSTGVISGVPTATGKYTILIAVSDIFTATYTAFTIIITEKVKIIDFVKTDAYIRAHNRPNSKTYDIIFFGFVATLYGGYDPPDIWTSPDPKVPRYHVVSLTSTNTSIQFVNIDNDPTYIPYYLYLNDDDFSPIDTRVGRFIGIEGLTFSNLGPHNFTLVCSSIDLHEVTQNFQITLYRYPQINSDIYMPTDLTLNETCSGYIKGLYGKTPYTYGMNVTIPGVTFNTSNGTLSGIPTTVTNYNIILSYSDANVNNSLIQSMNSTDAINYELAGYASTATLYSTTYAVSVKRPLTITTQAMSNGVTTIDYSVTMTATGGTTPYKWTITGLPNGMSYNTSTGVVSGAPLQAGTFTVKITCTDSRTKAPVKGGTAPRSISKSISWVVINNLIITTTSITDTGTYNVAYSTSMAATGGVPAYTWSLSGAPTGITINANTGVISGTPTVVGNFNMTVTVTDSVGLVRDKTFSLLISYPPIVITSPSSLPNGMVNETYEATQMQGTGGSGAGYVWTWTNSPTGLSLNSSTGIISGMPTTEKTYTITMRLTDSADNTTTKNYQVVIEPERTEDVNGYPYPSGTLVTSVLSHGNISATNGALFYRITEENEGLYGVYYHIYHNSTSAGWLHWYAYIVLRVKDGDYFFVNTYHRGSSWGTRISAHVGYGLDGTQYDVIHVGSAMDNGVWSNMDIYFIKP